MDVGGWLKIVAIVLVVAFALAALAGLVMVVDALSPLAEEALSYADGSYYAGDDPYDVTSMAMYLLRGQGVETGALLVAIGGGMIVLVPSWILMQWLMRVIKD